MSFKIVRFTVAAALISMASQAQASSYHYLSNDTPAFTFSDLTVSSFGVGVPTLNSSIDVYSNGSTNTSAARLISSSEQHTAVILAPTTTTTGTVMDYIVNSYVGQLTSASGNSEVAKINVTSDSTQYAGDKYILVSGKINTSILVGTGFYAEASSNGNLRTNNSIVPGVPVSPGGVSFYFGESSNSDALAFVQASSMTTSNAIDQSYTATTWMGGAENVVMNSYNLAFGQPLNFAALIYASNGASLANSNIQLNTSSYNFSYGTYDNGSVYTENVTIGYRTIPAVPEPETYGMMLMGLGFMGFVVRRRTNNQA